MSDLKVGQRWAVKLPEEISLSDLWIIEITENTVMLSTSTMKRSINTFHQWRRYMKKDLGFIDILEDNSKE